MLAAASHQPRCHHGQAAVLGGEHQRLDRRAPCERVVLALRQAGDVVAGGAVHLAAIGQGMGPSKERCQPLLVEPLEDLATRPSLCIDLICSVQVVRQCRLVGIGAKVRRLAARLASPSLGMREPAEHNSMSAG
jgi:hypothetical protein